MKRFIVFYNKYFDAKGGFLDYLDDFDTELEARRFVKGLLPSENRPGKEALDGWWQIVDWYERKIYLNNGHVFKFPNDGKMGRRNLKDDLKKSI